MKVLGPKTVFAILLAAMLCACIIIAIEGGVNFFHMLVGFVLAFVMGSVILHLRWAPVVFVTAIVFILATYGAIKFEWAGAAWGAIPGVATVMIFQFGWIRPHQKDSFDHDEYVQKQKEIHEKEKSGGHEDYAAQQKAQYEKEKAEKEGGGEEKAAAGD